jgi:hypothetical protein
VSTVQQTPATHKSSNKYRDLYRTVRQAYRCTLTKSCIWSDCQFLNTPLCLYAKLSTHTAYLFNKCLIISIFYNIKTMPFLVSTGFDWKDMEPCVQWMAPFAKTHMDEGSVEVKFFPTIPAEDSHNIQIHAVDLNMLVRCFTHIVLLVNHSSDGWKTVSTPKTWRKIVIFYFCKSDCTQDMFRVVEKCRSCQ